MTTSRRVIARALALASLAACAWHPVRGQGIVGIENYRYCERWVPCGNDPVVCAVIPLTEDVNSVHLVAPDFLMGWLSSADSWAKTCKSIAVRLLDNLSAFVNVSYDVLVFDAVLAIAKDQQPSVFAVAFLNNDASKKSVARIFVSGSNEPLPHATDKAGMHDFLANHNAGVEPIAVEVPPGQVVVRAISPKPLPSPRVGTYVGAIYGGMQAFAYQLDPRLALAITGFERASD